MVVKRGRPRKPPKPKVSIKELLQYIEQLPEESPIKQQLATDKMIRIKRYIEELQYLDFVIVNLKADIEINGEIEVYKNGSQETRRTNPALTTYIDTVKTYNQLLRQVSETIRGVELLLERIW
ncbi:MAG: hypothetical protein WAX04_12985 [Oscillospiraceae bacterium]